MRVLLVNTSHVVGKHYVVLPPLNLGYVAEAARREGHDVEIVDAIKDDMAPAQFADLLERAPAPYDVIGFSYFSPMRTNVLAFSKLAHERFPDTKLIVGGPHPVFEPEETLRSAPWMDVAVTGEAELIFPRLLDALAADGPLDGIPNLAWRTNGHVEKTPVEFIPDLDELPIPAWDLLRPDRYPLAPNGVFSSSSRIAPVFYTRGCPFPCKFCGTPGKSGKTIRTRDPENVVAEAEMLQRDYGVPELHIMDDVFTTKRAYAESICEAFLRMDTCPRFMLPNGIRLDSLDEPLLRLMQRAGCQSFAVGIESGSQHILDLMDKRLDLGLVHEKVELVRRTTDIRITGFFILGFPGETPADLHRTVDLAVSLPIHRANFFNYTPFPGGPLYYHLKEQGELGPDVADDRLIYSVSYAPEGLSRDRLKWMVRYAYCRFYLRPKILRGLAREIHSLDQVKNILLRAWNILR